jgi:hypothetical protein
MEKQNKHDAQSGNDGSTIWLLEQEGLIDPGNEHNHNEEWNCSEEPQYNSKFDADAGGDGTGTAGPAPEEISEPKRNEDGKL